MQTVESTKNHNHRRDIGLENLIRYYLLNLRLFSFNKESILILYNNVNKFILISFVSLKSDAHFYSFIDSLA